MDKTARPGFVKSCVQAVARWAGIPIDAGDGTAYNLGDRVAQGLAGGPKGAMQISAAWACVTLIADTISTLPLNLYEKRGTDRTVADEHPLQRVLHVQPNADQTAATFWGAVLASLLLRGEAYAEIHRSAGRIIAIDFLPFDCVQRQRLPGGGYRYRFTRYGKTREIPVANIWRLVGFTLDGENGCSAIEYGCRVFGSARAADVAASGTFERGLLPTTFFKYPTQLKPNQRADARKLIERLSGAVNAGAPVILEAGMEAGEIGIKPSDAQLLESRQFSVEEICSWFHVPPFMIGRSSQGQTNWGTGIEQQMIGFVTFALRKWIKRIEGAIAKDLLKPEERARFYAEFSIEGLLRGDSTSRREFYASALQNGWMNRNQVARLENLPAVPGGDVYTVQSNLIPIEKLGMLPPPAASTRARALLSWLSEDRENEPDPP